MICGKIWRLYFDGYCEKKQFKIHFELVIKVMFVVGDTQQIPYPHLED